MFPTLVVGTEEPGVNRDVLVSDLGVNSPIGQLHSCMWVEKTQSLALPIEENVKLIMSSFDDGRQHRFGASMRLITYTALEVCTNNRHLGCNDFVGPTGQSGQSAHVPYNCASYIWKE